MTSISLICASSLDVRISSAVVSKFSFTYARKIASGNVVSLIAMPTLNGTVIVPLKNPFPVAVISVMPVLLFCS